MPEHPSHHVGMRQLVGVTTTWGLGELGRRGLGAGPVGTRRGDRRACGHVSAVLQDQELLSVPWLSSFLSEPRRVAPCSWFWEQARTLMSGCSWSQASFSIPTTGM